MTAAVALAPLLILGVLVAIDAAARRRRIRIRNSHLQALRRIHERTRT